MHIGTSGRRSSRSTGNNVSGNYFRRYFLFFFPCFSSIATFSHIRSAYLGKVDWSTQKPRVAIFGFAGRNKMAPSILNGMARFFSSQDEIAQFIPTDMESAIPFYLEWMGHSILAGMEWAIPFWPQISGFRPLG